MQILNISLNFERILLFLYCLLIISVILLNLIDVYNAYLLAFTMFIPFIIMCLYAFKSKIISHALLIFLTSFNLTITAFSILDIFNYQFIQLLCFFISFLSVIALIILLVISIFKLKYRNEIKVFSILLLVFALFQLLLPVLTNYYDIYLRIDFTSLLMYPILFFLIYMYFQKGLDNNMTYVFKTLMLNYGTLIWVNLFLTLELTL